eukprot:5985186-Pyramimonas_sp.AAC.1
MPRAARSSLRSGASRCCPGVPTRCTSSCACSAAAGRVCRATRNLGVDICGLQEVAKWGKLSGFVYSQLVLYTKTTSDCGFLVSRRLMPAVRKSVFGQFWAGLVLGR